MGATKMDKMLIKAYKMLEEKGQHVINPANEDTILKTAGPVVDAGQSTGIGICRREDRGARTGCGSQSHRY